jgi:hypothetical protein
MACTKLLSFAEIVQGRDASVRIADDGMSADVVDTVMVVTGKDCNQTNELLRNLKPSLFDKENFFMHQGRRHATLRDIITLIMVLPGKMAKEIRSQFTAIIEKHIKVQHDALSGVTTATLQSDPVPVEDNEARRKRVKREDLELLKLEHEINTIIVENKMKEQTRIIAVSMEIERIRDPSRSNLDSRTRLMIQDALQNSIITTAQAQSASGAAGNGPMIANGPSPNASISISYVAAQLGYRPSSNDAKRIGGEVRKRYIEVHNKPPPKHDQLCDGRVTSVNSYTEYDRALVEEALHSYFSLTESDEDNTYDPCEVAARELSY